MLVLTLRIILFIGQIFVQIVSMFYSAKLRSLAWLRICSRDRFNSLRMEFYTETR